MGLKFFVDYIGVVVLLASPSNNPEFSMAVRNPGFVRPRY